MPDSLFHCGESRVLAVYVFYACLPIFKLRRRVNAGMNKDEARNALVRAMFFNQLGEIRYRSVEQQRYLASGLNWVTATIVLWIRSICSGPRMPCTEMDMLSMAHCCNTSYRWAGRNRLRKRNLKYVKDYWRAESSDIA